MNKAERIEDKLDMMAEAAWKKYREYNVKFNCSIEEIREQRAEKQKLFYAWCALDCAHHEAFKILVDMNKGE